MFKLVKLWKWWLDYNRRNIFVVIWDTDIP